jgi:hypothetical protein
LGSVKAFERWSGRLRQPNRIAAKVRFLGKLIEGAADGPLFKKALPRALKAMRAKSAAHPIEEVGAVCVR